MFSIFFLSTYVYLYMYQWSSPAVWVPLVFAIAFALLFVIVELYLAPEPVLAPFLLRQKIPVLVGISNFLVATCNFTVMYNFPTWFQTVLLTSASEAGMFCLLLGIVALSLASSHFYRCALDTQRRVYLSRIPVCWVSSSSTPDSTLSADAGIDGSCTAQENTRCSTSCLDCSRL